MVLWGVRGLYGTSAVEHKACPPTIVGEPPYAIKHPPAIGPLGCLRTPLNVVREVFGCQRAHDYNGKEVYVR